MKKKTFLFSLFVCLCFWVNGQVFISEVIAEKLLLGPENITGNHVQIAIAWNKIILEFQDDLGQVAEENLASIAVLKQLKRLRRKDQQKRARLEEENLRIAEELILTEELLEQWDSWAFKATRLGPTSESAVGVQCWELIVPDEETLVHEVAIKEAHVVTEFIPTEYIESKREWIKKKADRNCLSSDPNDCLVWCLVEVKGGLRFVDYEGITHEPETCPVDFTYDGASQSCQRKWRLVACQ